MPSDVNSYLMENPDEEARLALKTGPENLERQAIWCGIRPGMRVLDAGCGIGSQPGALRRFGALPGWFCRRLSSGGL